jgi:hypothetical protein
MSLPLCRRIEINAGFEEFRCVEFEELFLLGTLSQPPLK